MTDRKRDLLDPDFEPTDEELREIEDAFGGAVLLERRRVVLARKSILLKGGRFQENNNLVGTAIGKAGRIYFKRSSKKSTGKALRVIRKASPEVA